MRLIDADKLLRDIEHYNLSDGKFQHWVEIQPTVEPVTYEHRHFLKILRDLPSAESNIAEKLHQCKCYITDKKGLQHEVIYIDDIRRVTGWVI